MLAPGDPKFGRILDFSESSHKIGIGIKMLLLLAGCAHPTPSSLSSPWRSVGIIRSASLPWKLFGFGAYPLP
jgi:hypothetical protein